MESFASVVAEHSGLSECGPPVRPDSPKIRGSQTSILVRRHRCRHTDQFPDRRGLLIPHPNGIVIHPGARIGCNCLIFQQVTIGATTKGIPTIGGHVDIGAGAKIIGPVTIGDHARIGANAVVYKDIPPYGVFVADAGRLLARE